MRRNSFLLALAVAVAGCSPVAPPAAPSPAPQAIAGALPAASLTVSTLAGAGAGRVDGPLAQARFYRPHALAYGADGTLYVADSGNDRLRKVAPDGAVSTLETSVTLEHPTGLAVAPDGTLYVTELLHNQVFKVTPDGAVSALAGASEAGFADGAAGAARFYDPIGLALGPDGSLYVADSGNDRIRKIAQAGLTCHASSRFRLALS